MNHVKKGSPATYSNNVILHIGIQNERNPGKPGQNECNLSEPSNPNEAGMVAYVHHLIYRR